MLKIRCTNLHTATQWCAILLVAILSLCVTVSCGRSEGGGQKSLETEAERRLDAINNRKALQEQAPWFRNRYGALLSLADSGPGTARLITGIMFEHGRAYALRKLEPDLRAARGPKATLVAFFIFELSQGLHPEARARLIHLYPGACSAPRPFLHEHYESRDYAYEGLWYMTQNRRGLDEALAEDIGKSPQAFAGLSCWEKWEVVEAAWKEQGAASGVKARPLLQHHSEGRLAIARGDIKALRKACDNLSEDFADLVTSLWLHRAAWLGRDEMVEELLARGGMPSLRDERGWTALHWAASMNRSALLRRLSAAAAKPVVDAPDGRGWQPLHVAAMADAWKSAEALLELGADPNAADGCRERPLHWAGRFGNKAVAESLLAGGAETDCGNWRGETPLHIAVYRQHNAVAEALLQAGADANARMVWGNAPLHYVCGHQHDVSLTEMLLKHGADPDAANDEGRTPLHSATHSHRDEIVAALLGAGAAPDAADAEGRTPLHLARTTGVQNLLLEGGADPEARDHDGQTPLHLAVKVNTFSGLDVVEVLLGAGADPSAQDSAGQTPMHKAAAEGSRQAQEILQALMEAGADAGARDKEGKTALDLAVAAGHEQAAKWLREHAPAQ